MICIKGMVIGLFGSALFSFLAGNVVFAEGPSAAEYGVVLNLSGKQRMLSQKMSKEVLLVYKKYNVKENLQNLQKTSSLFDTTMKGLRDGNSTLALPPTESRRILRQIDKNIIPLWAPFYENIQKILANSAVDEEQLAYVAENNLPLLTEMNTCVTLYEKDAAKAGMKSDPGLAVAINLAGKQRMLTQKMSKEFLLIACNYKVEENRLSLQETANLFERTLAGLLDGDTTLDLQPTEDSAIRGQLQNVQKLWADFKPLVEYALTTKESIADEKIAALAEQNIPLLQEMNKAVSMYEALATK